MYIENISEHRDKVSQALADRLAQVLSQAVEARGAASLVVSGGSSPVALFHALRACPLAWDKVTIIPSDERVVPKDHADSNASMIRRELLQEHASAANLVDLVSDAQDPEASLRRAQKELSEILRPFDAVVLGMGDDGHTASLFPDAPDIEQTLQSNKLCVLQHIPRLEHPRMSLTVHTLLQTREIDLLLFGQKKLNVLNEAKQPGRSAVFPVRAILQQQDVPVTTYWAP